MLVAQSVIETLANRIERAYRLRRQGWRGACSSPRLWTLAAENLIHAREQDRELPLDPELYVAAQPCDPTFAEPWNELTGAEAVERYRKRVAAIILRLRDELVGEIDYAERKIERGDPPARILTTRTRRLSPLGRFIIAHRVGRSVLANRFHQAALEQHRACPLYRQACSSLLPEGLYPGPASRSAPVPFSPASAAIGISTGAVYRN